jgi:hypothetical protein
MQSCWLITTEIWSVNTKVLSRMCSKMQISSCIEGGNCILNPKYNFIILIWNYVNWNWRNCSWVTCFKIVLSELIHIVTYSGCSIHDGTLMHSKSQYTTVKHSRQLSKRTYTSDPHGLGTLAPIEFFQQDLLWQSSNTRSHSCSQKAFKHTSGQSIIGLSVRLHTTTAPRRIVHH